MRRAVRNRAGLLSALLCLAPVADAVTYQVNSNGDASDANTSDGICETSTPGQCTLRAAVEQANVTGGVINVPATTITVTDYIAIRHDMSIVGAGMRSTVVSGAGLYAIFDIGNFASPPAVVLSDLTLRDAHPLSGNGGAIHQYLGKLTLDRCFFTNNYAYVGGAVLVDHTDAKIRDSVFTDNHAPGGIAGAVASWVSTLAMTNVSLIGNSAEQGGALAVLFAGVSTLTNVTVSGNSAEQDGGAISVSGGTDSASSLALYSSTVVGNRAYDGAGGGIWLADANQGATIQNTILAGNLRGCGLCFTSVSNCSGTITSLGKAVVAGGGCAVNGAFTTADPKLGPLQENGGSSGPTHALKAGSSAIDSGTVGGCPLTDQRGVHRETGVACDMGAYEHSPCGDVNGDGCVSVTDVFFLVNYLFAGGPVPPGLANVNGDGVTNVSDVFYLVNLLFAGGPAGQCAGT